MTVKEYKSALVESLIPTRKGQLARVDSFLERYYKAIQDPNLSFDDKEDLFNRSEKYDTIDGKTVPAHVFRRWLEHEIDRLEAEAAPTDQKFFNMHLYSDIKPYACVKEFTPNKVGVVRMETTAGPKADGPGHQDWICTKRENWTEDDMIILTRRKNGMFYQVGDHSCPCTVSREPLHYYDWSF